MERTVLSLPGYLHLRTKQAAAERGISMAELIRETLEEAAGGVSSRRLGEQRAIYVAERQGRRAGDMKRIVVSIPDELLRRVKLLSAGNGVSMAALTRHLLEERLGRERPKPRFGAFDSGYTDTARLASDMQFEPASWR